MTRRRVTIGEIALASNASAATVSLALRNKPGVSRETRERILVAAQKLGYRGKIRGGRTEGPALRNIALVFRTWSEGPERSSPALNPFYSWVLTGIQEAGTDAAMNLMLGTIPVDADNQPIELPRPLLRQPLDGVLLVGSHRAATVETVLDLLNHPAGPVVLVDSTDQGQGLDAVCSDNHGGAYLATVSLIAAGHRRIAWVGPLETTDRNFEQRRAGFVQALADHGLVPAGTNDQPGQAEWQRGLDAVLANATASFCGNDDTALAMIAECSRRGVAIPDQHSVIGFDDTNRARDATPPLTTMAVDKLALGRLAVEALEYRIRWPENAPFTVTLTPRLIERESVKEVHEEA